MANAQTLASIQGTVHDASGAPVADAAVSAHNTGTGLDRATRSDAAGRYSVLSLPAGDYTVRAEKSQFRAEVHQGIHLDEGARLAVDFALQVGEVRQEITVSDTASPLNTAMDQTAGLVNERQVQGSAAERPQLR